MTTGIGLTTFAQNISDGWVVNAIRSAGLSATAMGLFLVGSHVASTAAQGAS